MTEEQIKENIRNQFDTELDEKQKESLQGFENMTGKDLKKAYQRFHYYLRKKRDSQPKKVDTTVNDGSNELSTLNDMAVAIQSEEWTTEGLTYILHKIDEVKDLVEKKIQSNKEQDIEKARQTAIKSIEELNKLSGKDYKLSE